MQKLYGNYISQTTISGNHTDPATSQSGRVDAPTIALHAYVWVWIGFGPEVPIVVNNISLNAV